MAADQELVGPIDLWLGSERSEAILENQLSCSRFVDY